ncbi:MAG: hypothetical protein GY856_21400 [bacterium]|nr:hypothetical protein [bacterium]
MRKMLTVALAILLVPVVAFAIVPPEKATPEKAAGKVIHNPSLMVQPALERFERGAAAHKRGMAKFYERHSSDWKVTWDDRGDLAHLIEGSGVPVVPGAGNGLRSEGKISITDVEQKVRDFMGEFPELFDVDQSDLRLDKKTSGEFGKMWVIDLQQHHKGVPIDGAKVFFRISNGNIVQFGNDLVGHVRTGVRPRLSADDAMAAALAAGGFSREIEVLNPGELKIVTMLPPGEAVGNPFGGAPGQGYRHVLVREVGFRVADDTATYKALVNAHNGKVLELVDTNAYAVKGGIYPKGPNDTEVERTFQYANGTLNGTYVRINDNCGSISLTDCGDGSCDGDINFGMSGGDDCTTPGYGGAGNTHSARCGHYHTTNINRVADSYLPSNSWIDSKLTANMNINDTCNAYWNGSTINFYRSGGGCGNTGEIAAVFLHEWGHGLDSNTGGPASGDAASGEAVGDVLAAIHLQDGCIGPGFLSTNCYNCSGCTGVRDIADFSYNDGTAIVAKPSTITSSSGPDCDRWTCPYSGYMGPMGYEGHCEGYITASAVWDVGAELRAKLGTAAGWSKVEQLVFDSISTAQSGFRIVSGGQCNTSATIDGCASSNWYKAFLVADDDDGNLANGTPNCEEIWDAFNYHEIACGTKASECPGGGCTPTENPEVSCSDGVDNDCDGLTDGADPDCVTCTPTENPEVSCSDGVDNDCDGLTDGADPDCQGGSGELFDEVPETGVGGSTGTELDYYIVVPSGQDTLDVTLTGSDPDADLYVKFGSPPTRSSYDCRSWTSSSNESCSFDSPSGGTWYVLVYAYSTFANATLVADYEAPPQGCDYYDSLSGISGSSGSWNRYTQEVPACASTMTIQISGGTGDADLYVRFGSEPSTSSWDCRPYLWGNNESCTITPTQTGTYHIGIHAYSAYSGVLLEAEYH